ncbi:hypothetical protein [Chryseobacterium sp. HSC-36S06]|uniref:hypothetical protein n=1 Tax=Chryseobacterium sp. HSC-36S06 TaxID=2910970 RepID=UPI0020A1F50E|nr:hypothetical protein [Chryseobacterium sp. HSC-36S06]MCP2037334.1 hypothetical protein [Chryseobacterium sp. HSC-36S06]
MLTDKESLEFFYWLLESDKGEDLYLYFVNNYNRENPNHVFTGDQAFEPLFNLEIRRHSLLFEKDLTSNYLAHEPEYDELLSTLDKFINLSRMLYPNFSYLHSELEKLQALAISMVSKSKENYLSMKWLVGNESLSVLYDKLVEEPPMIFCAKSDFIKAFTGLEVTTGINWLAKGKNGQINKALLMYFLDSLDEDGCIAELDNFSKTIETIFRDANGEKLKYLKQSKNSKTTSPHGHQRIDDILNEIRPLKEIKQE